MRVHCNFRVSRNAKHGMHYGRERTPVHEKFYTTPLLRGAQRYGDLQLIAFLMQWIASLAMTDFTLVRGILRCSSRFAGIERVNYGVSFPAMNRTNSVM